MHTFDDVAKLLGGVRPGAAGLAEMLQRLSAGQGDDVSADIGDGVSIVRQTTWRLMQERPLLSPAVFDAWNELWIGAALAHDRFLKVEITLRRDYGDPCWEWRIARRAPH
jgi:hypothetical protein